MARIDDDLETVYIGLFTEYQVEVSGSGYVRQRLPSSGSCIPWDELTIRQFGQPQTRRKMEWQCDWCSTFNLWARSRCDSCGGPRLEPRYDDGP